MTDVSKTTDASLRTARGSRVCVVEDDALVARTWKRALAGQWEVHVVGTFWEAKRLVASGGDRAPFDVFVLDLHLPDGDGTELVPLVRRLTPAPLVVVVSGQLDAARSVKLLSDGVIAIPKPIDVSTARTLLARLRPPPSISSRTADLVSDYAERFGLSARERAVLLCAAEGLSLAETAEALGCRTGTIKNHWGRIFDKTDLRTRRDVIADVLRRVSNRHSVVEKAAVGSGGQAITPKVDEGGR